MIFFPSLSHIAPSHFSLLSSLFSLTPCLCLSLSLRPTSTKKIERHVPDSLNLRPYARLQETLAKSQADKEAAIAERNAALLDKEESDKAREAGNSEEVSALAESNKELEEQVEKLKGRVVEMNELLSGSDEIAVELQFLKKAVSGVSLS
jgi:hypothetical protein